MTDSTKFFVEKRDWGRTFGVFIYAQDDQHLWQVKPVRMEQVEGGFSNVAAQEPSLFLQPIEAQRLMDSLWDAGLRPTEGTGSAGSLAATQKHLEDMRALVFKKEQPK